LNCAITSGPPPDCYPAELKSRGEYTINQFSKYENVLAFSAGNEVSLDPIEGAHNTENAPCQKKFLKDMRSYVNRCSNSMRKIPVGIIQADIDREDKALYYSCRTNPTDETENTDFIGINTYLHCDGSATSTSELLGYKQLLSDYTSYDMSVPVIVTEFGCVHDSFATNDGYEAQRNFLQVDALFSEEYRQQFAGGFVFEYSTEKTFAQDTSPYPFDTFGPQNSGVGYFTPEDCDDLTTACEYERFPQFDALADKYDDVDVSQEPNLVFYKRMWENPGIPSCPTNFPSLDSFTWPSDSVPLQECPVEVPMFCAGVPVECSVVTLPPINTSSAPASYCGRWRTVSDSSLLMKAVVATAAAAGLLLVGLF